jgi:hypothetical protein
VDVATRVSRALQRHPAVTAVRLAGSRQRGAAGCLSDWDFEVDTLDFRTLAGDLPALVSPLRPLVQQWDPLSRRATYMLILPGAVKIDLLFDQPHELESAWEVGARTLEGIDHHFWDWILWIAAKEAARKHELVQRELAKISSHLLGPMGVERVPDSIETAITLYTSARRELENRLGVVVPKGLEDEIRQALRRSGHDV